MVSVTVRRDVRWFWAGLSVLLIGGVVGSLILASDVRAREEENARTDAQSAVAYGIVPLFEPTDLQGPIQGERYTKLASEIRTNILSKSPYDKINVWGIDGTVLFSTDPALIGQHITGAQKQLVHQVIKYGTQSRPVGKTFQSYVSLTLRGAPASSVVELDQPYGPVWSAANKPWRILAIVLGVLSFASMLMFALTFRPVDKPSVMRMPHWTGRHPDPKAIGAPGSSQSTAAYQAEVGARLKAEQRAKEAEQRTREAEDQFQKALQELRASEARVKQGQAGLQGPLDELRKMQAQLQSTGERLRQVEAERSSLEDALRQAQQQPAAASPSSSTDPAAEEQARAAQARVVELQSRLAEAEVRASEAEKRS